MNRRNFMQTAALVAVATSPLLTLAQDDIHFASRVAKLQDGETYEVFGWRWDVTPSHGRSGYDFARPPGTWEAASAVQQERWRSVAERYMRGTSSES